MGVFFKIIGILATVFVCLFLLSFAIYFFNLDMKMMAALEPVLEKIYDKRKRTRKL